MFFGETVGTIEQVEEAMTLLGAKWRPAIMYALIEDGTKRFSELRRAIPAVSQRMLTKQLRELERAGLITRTFHPSVPPRVEYSATELGRSLAPIYRAVCDWSALHQDHLRAAAIAYDRENAG